MTATKPNSTWKSSIVACYKVTIPDGRAGGSAVAIKHEHLPGDVDALWLLTCAHVADANPEPNHPLMVHDAAGNLVGVAVEVARHPELDVALMQVLSVDLPEHAAPVRLEALSVGDGVTVLGFPFGRSLTISAGFVGEVCGADGDGAMSASIAPGNSGGPVVDSAGRLVGIAASQWCNVGPMMRVGVPHMSYYVPTASLRGWLSELGMIERP